MTSRHTTIARAIARRAYHQPAIRNFYENTVRSLKSPVKKASSYETIGTFVPDDGRKIRLLDGLRDDIKPNWREMVSPPAQVELPGTAAIAAKSSRCRADVAEAVSFLSAHGLDLTAKDVLEIGCYDGVHGRHLSASSGSRVVSSDISAYYIRQRQDEDLNDQSRMKQQSSLDGLRARCATWLDENLEGGEPVEFVEDNISESTLPDDRFDAIFSWEVLEHVADPGAAFQQMHRILRPGGVCYHDYNPFFSFNGGHSLATLDFHWGHARLSADEFDRYVDELRPLESDIDKSFFHESLNRMSLSDVRRLAEEASLEVIALVPYIDQTQVDLLEPTTLGEVQAHHESVTALDLISPRVVVVLRKP